MAKNTNIKKGNRFLVPLFVLIFALVLSFIVVLAAFIKQAELISKYELIEKIDNQACRYLDRQVAVNGAFDLTANAKDGQPKLTYWCWTGEKTSSKEIHGKFIDAYNFGAIVRYFSSNEEAEKFALEEINPLRYWGVDEEGQRNGIPQTSKFTFLVTDEAKPYFDAYTVKATAVLRVSLLCNSQDLNVCAAEGNAVLDRELKGINVL